MLAAVPDELIMALADGELDTSLASRVRDAIRADMKAQRKYDAFVGTRAVGGAAFRGILAEPIPERLMQVVARQRPWVQ